MQNVTVRKIGKYLFGVQDHDRTVTEIRLLHAGALGILPAIERRAEERLEQQGPRARLALHKAHEEALAFALVDLHVGVLELAAPGGAQPDLHLLVEDQLIVLGNVARQGKLRPAIFERDIASQVIRHQARAELRFVWIGKQFRVAIEHAMGRVAAIFVHGGDHDELEWRRHGYSLKYRALETVRIERLSEKGTGLLKSCGRRLLRGASKSPVPFSDSL